MPDDKLLVGFKAIAHFFGWEVGGLGERRVRHLSTTQGLPLIRKGPGVCADPNALIAWVAQKKRESSHRS